MSNSEMLDAHEAAELLGVTTARVHQLATPTAKRGPVLAPAIEKRSPSGKITHRLFRADDVRRLVELREALPPTGRGPQPWDAALARAELGSQSS